MTFAPDAARQPLVEVSHATKSYGRRRALDDVSLTIPRATITAIIGPNGAGKTTLNKALLGLVRLDGGTLRFDGDDMTTRVEHRARIGYMPQAPSFPESFTGRDVLTLLSELRGSSATRDESLLERLDVSRFLDQPVRALSGGQRQRLNAAAAFLFAPELLLLDEPTAGLDPIASSILKDQIREQRDGGRAVVITSHVMSELEELADAVVLLLDGRVCWSGALPELLRHTGERSLERAIAHLMHRATPAAA